MNDIRRPATITSDFLEGLVKRVPGGTGNTWKLTEVYTGDLLVELPQSSPDDIARAFDDARAAQQIWASWPLRKRLKVLKKFHALVIKNQFLITDLIQAESGKNRRMAFEESCDVPMGTSHYVKRAPKLLKDRKHAGPVPFLSHSTEVRRPKGVVAIIAPWNFPFATGISDTIPALIAGNGVVLKPDNKTALSPLFGVRLLEQAGIPPGLVQVVCGEGPDVGEPMLANADYVMFTGSTATGRIIGELAGKNLIDCCLELGGKNPMLVLADADVDEAVHAALFGGFGNSGQICMHIERLYIHDSIYERVPRQVRRGHGGAEHRRCLRLRTRPRLPGLGRPPRPRGVARRRRPGEGRHRADRRAGEARPRAGLLRADHPRGRHPGDARRLDRDLRPGGGPVPLPLRGRGDRGGQRHRATASTPASGARTWIGLSPWRGGSTPAT